MAALLLLCLGGLFLYHTGGKPKNDRLAEVSKQIGRETHQIIQEALKQGEQLKKEIKADSTVRFSSFTDKTYEYPFFVYKNGSLLYWSDYHLKAEYEDIAGSGKVKVARLNNGLYLICNTHFLKDNELYEIYTFHPLKKEYLIENKYVEAGLNDRIFPVENVRLNLSPTIPSDHVLKTDEGHFLYSLTFTGKHFNRNSEHRDTALLLWLAGTVCLVVFVLITNYRFIHKGLVTRGFFIVVLTLAGLRAVMLLSGFTEYFSHYKIFNPGNYASSSLAPSVGDLLLNIFFAAIISWTLLRSYFRLPWTHLLLRAPQKVRITAGGFFIVVAFYTLLAFYRGLEKVFFHSQWNYDITESLSFPLLKLLILLALIILAATIFFFTHILIRLFINLLRNKYWYGWLLLGTGGILFYLTAFYVYPDAVKIVAPAGLLYLGILYATYLPKSFYLINYYTYWYYLVFMLVGATLMGTAVLNTSTRKSLLDKHKFASRLLIENDYQGEYLLREIRKKIKQDKFINKLLLFPFASKDLIAEKINRKYLGKYFDKYKTDIAVYDALGSPYVALTDKNRDIRYFETRFKSSAYATDHEGIYFVNKPAGTNRYYCFIELSNKEVPMGYILIRLTLKKIIPHSAYPRLLVDKELLQSRGNKKYNYAIYRDGALMSSFGHFNYDKTYQKQFDPPRNNKEAVQKVNGFSHLIIGEQPDKTVVISSPSYPIYRLSSNFSFYFLLLLLLMIAFLMVYAVDYKVRMYHLQFSTKIQLFLHSAYFIPLIVISIVILSVTGKSFQQELKRSFRTKAGRISENVTSSLKAYHKNVIGEEKLREKLAQAARFSETDLNLYNKQGKLLYSTQPMIFESGFLSNLINPRAYTALMERKEKNILVEENVGSLSYNTVYVSVRSMETGRFLGILSIPFFESGYELEQKMSKIFSVLLIIFCGFFIAFFGVFYFTSRSLTAPLKMLRQKLQRTSLGGTNTPLKWRSNDEIGWLVQEYNKMLNTLEENRKALARQEKESAWKEMAQQVAHEVKNPLTTIKLNLQQLYRRVKKLDDDKDGHLKQNFDTVLNHVDTLSDIASSFSSFAKMPDPRSEYFNITGVLINCALLYKNSENGIVTYEIEDNDAFVKGDPQLMERIFSNLIINGLQAVPEEKSPHVYIRHCKTINREVLIEIRDNGRGIPEELWGKVFLPNFSTKTEGSGIGLAIAKKGVEYAGGRIWFETRLNEGTSFFIEIPLADQ